MNAVSCWVPKCCSSVVKLLQIDAVMKRAMKQFKLRSVLAFMLNVLSRGPWGLSLKFGSCILL